MPNPFVDASRDDRWETGVPELNMQQLRAPECLRWLKDEAKPATMPLGTFALSSMFDRSLIAAIIAGKHKEVIRRYVRTWPEMLTAVLREEGLTIGQDGLLTVVSDPDGRQRKPLSRAERK